MADTVRGGRIQPLLKKKPGTVRRAKKSHTNATGGAVIVLYGSTALRREKAAEVVAQELNLHLSRVDLSAVVSKYIGETEKNLNRVFDMAERNGTILFFDEADALFGKRSQVTDAHDRYADTGVAHLLQRIENYKGLVILTTNGKRRIDQAFSPQKPVVVLDGKMKRMRKKKE
jgi:SpoVK/Ycf46/Vps4 family AAA+-type ATPase